MHNYFKMPKTTDEAMLLQEKQLFPSILAEQASSTFLGIVNTIVMGMVSTAALAGVGQINSLNTMVFMFFNSLAQGGTVMVAQNIGAKNPKKARESFAQAILSGLVMAVVVTVVLFFCKTWILNVLFGGVEADVMKSSLDYFTVTLFATPLWFLYYQIAGAMRGSGDTKTPMKATIVMNVVNVVCSLVFVLVFKLGSLGTGISLVISVCTGMLVCLAKVLQKDYPLALPKLADFKPDFAEMKLIYSVGFPVAIENFMFHGGRLIVQVFISAMGTDMISAYQIANSICQIYQMPLMAYNMLIVSVVGQRAGAGGKQAVRVMLDYYNKKTTTLALYLGVVFMTITYPTAWLFTRDMAVINIVYGMMVMYGVFMPFYSASFNTPNGFRGARDTKFSLVVGTISMWIVRVIGSWFFGVYLQWGAYGVYLAMCLDWVVRAIAYMWWFKKDTWLRFVKD